MSDSNPTPGGLPQDPNRTLRGQLDLEAKAASLVEENDQLKADLAKAQSGQPASAPTGSVVKTQIKAAGLTGIVVGLFFLFSHLWLGWSFSTSTIVGTVIGLMVLAGFAPQILILINKIAPAVVEHSILSSAVLSATVGLTVAILGIKGSGWIWWVMFFSTVLGYGFLTYFAIWTIRIRGNSSQVTKIAAIVSWLILPAMMLAFFVHPVVELFGKSVYISYSSEALQGPVEHLVNTVICLSALLALIGVVAFVLRYGLNFFGQIASAWRDTMVGLRNQPGYMTIAKVVVFAAAVLVGTLVAVQLWPQDAANTGRKALSICVGLIAFLGFQFVKGRLIAAADEGKRSWHLFLLSLLVVIPASLISSARFYAGNSETQRLSHTIAVTQQLESDYYAKTASQAASYASMASTQEEKDGYNNAVLEMRAAIERTKSANNHRKVDEAVSAFKLAGAKLTSVLPEGEEDALSKVKVAPEPDATDLLAHVLGLGKAPEGVNQVYAGAAIGAFVTALLSEWMVLILYFIIIGMRWRKSGEEVKLIYDGTVISALNAEGKHFVVSLSASAANLMKRGIQVSLHQGDEMIGALEADKALGNGAWVFTRNNATRPVPNGTKTRVVS